MSGAPLRLRCEYLDNPSGIDVSQPRLSWWLGDERPAELQTGYHLLAASSLEQLDADRGDLWDSGKVETHRTYNIEYRGQSLNSEQRVWWKVRSFDSDGLPSIWSQASYFEMGLLRSTDWRARWIGAELQGSRSTPVQVPMLRRSFHLYSEITSARLYVAALGSCHLELNGQVVNPDQLGPPWSDYSEAIVYSSFTVTPHIRLGENVLGALLADGYYCGNPGLGARQQYGDQPWLALQLHLNLESGERMRIVSDDQWRWRPSWILYSDPSSGESQDARQRDFVWSIPDQDRDADAWAPVRIGELPKPAVAERGPGVRVAERLSPVGPPRISRGGGQHPGVRRLLYEFEENLVGRVSVEVKLRRGAELRVRYAESLDDSGRPMAGTEDVYTARGDEEGERFEPRFAVHGFQFVELEGIGLNPGLVKDIRALSVHATLIPAGTFSCDHALVNQLHDNVGRTLLGTSQFFPNAGFERSRRLGLTGPGQATLRSAAFHHDVASFYQRWLAALAASLGEDGKLSPIVPTPPDLAGVCKDGGGGWSDALVIDAWTLYRCYGDRRILEVHYGALLRFAEGLERRFPDHIRKAARNPLAAVDEACRDELGATAFFFYSAKLVVRIAGVLGNLSDLERFEQLAQSIRAAFRKRFVTADGLLAAETAGAYVLALHFGLLENGEARRAFDVLVAKAEDEGQSLCADPTVAPFLLQVFCAGGRLDLAYRLLLDVKPPSLLHAVLQGATTLWNETTGDWSCRAQAAVGEWLYSGMAGLDLDADLSDANNAYRRVRVQPQPPMGVGFSMEPPVRRVEATLDTVNGRYETHWEITDEAFELYLKVPCNCTAEVVMPDSSSRDVVAGEHRFRMAFEAVGDGIPVLLEVS